MGGAGFPRQSTSASPSACAVAKADAPAASTYATVRAAAAASTSAIVRAAAAAAPAYAITIVIAADASVCATNVATKADSALAYCAPRATLRHEEDVQLRIYDSPRNGPQPRQLRPRQYLQD